MRGNLYSQVYATDYQYSRTYPIKARSDVHETLEDFFRDVGVPSLLVSYGATELTDGKFKKKCRKAQCMQHHVEKDTQNTSSEGTIRELKRHFRRAMAAQNIPEVLWDYCLDWCSATRRHTAYNIHQLD